MFSRIMLFFDSNIIIYDALKVTNDLHQNDMIHSLCVCRLFYNVVGIWSM
jgi:hypothetical protein